jgi:LysM repeat protein
VIRQFPNLWVLVLLIAALPSLSAAERWHRVQPGESLYGLAREYGVSVADLAERNGLKTTAGLWIGQKLAIPSRETVLSAAHAALPSSVRKAIAAAPLKPGRWQRIVLHHSATTEATIKAMNQYHLQQRHMENGLAYHFVIGNGRGMKDGEIYVGNRWKKQLDGGHLASAAQNRTSLGICLVGNFDREVPTPRQMQSLTALVAALQRRCGLPDPAVVTHQQINTTPTRCPGKRFPMESFLRSLAKAKAQ